MASKTTRARQNVLREGVDCPVRIACDGTRLVAATRQQAGLCVACEEAQKRRNKLPVPPRGTGYRGT